MKPPCRDELERKEQGLLEDPDVRPLSQWLLMPLFPVVTKANAFSLGLNWVEEVPAICRQMVIR